MAHTPDSAEGQHFGEEEWRPARETKKQRAWRPGQRKRLRSVRALFTSTVLCLQAVVLFFVGMTIYGLNREDPNAVWFIVGYSALAVIAVLSCALVRKPVGIAIGWGIQAATIASAFWEYSMLVIGPLFALAWWYAVTKGDQLDRENLQREKLEEQWDREHGYLPADED
ncbi:MAG: DUF4233 domain-containing protein [Micrococcus sp.]|nr:DUF4233 domain-containing protein [Micrococcus sp.]